MRRNASERLQSSRISYLYSLSYSIKHQKYINKFIKTMRLERLLVFLVIFKAAQGTFRGLFFRFSQIRGMWFEDNSMSIFSVLWVNNNWLL